jgi:Kef-type K+ transport system membrane component KefB
VVKLLAKGVGVFPLTRAFRLDGRSGIYTTLLMSTGLTFGTIASLFGYQRGFITQGQYTILVAVVIGSAVIPTLIAQAFFLPENAKRTPDRSFDSIPEEVSTHVH